MGAIWKYRGRWYARSSIGLQLGDFDDPYAAWDAVEATYKRRLAVLQGWTRMNGNKYRHEWARATPWPIVVSESVYGGWIAVEHTDPIHRQLGIRGDTDEECIEKVNREVLGREAV